MEIREIYPYTYSDLRDVIKENEEFAQLGVQFNICSFLSREIYSARDVSHAARNG